MGLGAAFLCAASQRAEESQITGSLLVLAPA